MDTQKLAHLLAVVEHGTFSEAARAVHLTQPALSRSIRALEDELKAPLFDRGARRAHLTVFGELVVERARKMRLEEAHLKRDLDLMRGGEEGMLAIGVSPGPAALLLTPFLIHMAQTRPHVRIRTEIGATSTLLERLRSEAIDAIVGDAYVLQQEGDIDIDELGELRCGLVCRAGHPLLTQSRVTIEAIRSYPITTTTLSSAITRRLEELLEASHPRGSPFFFYCDNLEVLRRVTLETDTLMYGILAISHHELAAGALAEVPVEPDPELRGCYALARMAGRTFSPLLQALYDFAWQRWREFATDPLNH